MLNSPSRHCRQRGTLIHGPPAPALPGWAAETGCPSLPAQNLTQGFSSGPLHESSGRGRGLPPYRMDFRMHPHTDLVNTSAAFSTSPSPSIFRSHSETSPASLTYLSCCLPTPFHPTPSSPHIKTCSLVSSHSTFPLVLVLRMEHWDWGHAGKILDQ